MKDEKTRIFLGILGLICLVAMPVSAADNLRNEILSDWYILRARGKAAIIPLIKYLRAMHIDIYVMHDKDADRRKAYSSSIQSFRFLAK